MDRLCMCLFLTSSKIPDTNFINKGRCLRWFHTRNNWHKYFYFCVLFSNLMFCEANKLIKIYDHRISFLSVVSRRWVLLRNLQKKLKSTNIWGRGVGSQIKKHTTAVFTQIVFKLYDNIIVLLGISNFKHFTPKKFFFKWHWCTKRHISSMTKIL